jgi:hypothetical protein
MNRLGHHRRLSMPMIALVVCALMFRALFPVGTMPGSLATGEWVRMCGSDSPLHILFDRKAGTIVYLDASGDAGDVPPDLPLPEPMPVCHLLAAGSHALEGRELGLVALVRLASVLVVDLPTSAQPRGAGLAALPARGPPISA